MDFIDKIQSLAKRALSQLDNCQTEERADWPQVQSHQFLKYSLCSRDWKLRNTRLNNADDQEHPY